MILGVIVFSGQGPRPPCPRPPASGPRAPGPPAPVGPVQNSEDPAIRLAGIRLRNAKPHLSEREAHGLWTR